MIIQAQEIREKISKLRELHKDSDPSALKQIAQWEEELQALANKSGYFELAITQELLRDAREQIQRINKSLTEDRMMSTEERIGLLAERRTYDWYLRFLDPNFENKAKFLLNLVKYELNEGE